jgi:hypothetical protein
LGLHLVGLVIRSIPIGYRLQLRAASEYLTLIIGWFILASSFARHFVVYTCQQLHAAFCGFTCQQLRAAFCGCTCLQLRAAFSGLYLPAAWRGILWLYRLQLGAA